jgi:hypothetical protein
MKAQVSAAEHDRRREQSELSKQNEKPRVLSIPAAGAMVGLGRNASYAAAARGEMPPICFGKLKKVLAAPWLRMLGE